MQLVAFAVTDSDLWVSHSVEIEHPSCGFSVRVADPTEPTMPPGFVTAVLPREIAGGSLASKLLLVAEAPIILQLKIPITQATGLRAWREIVGAAYQAVAYLYPVEFSEESGSWVIPPRGWFYEVGVQKDEEHERLFRARYSTGR